MTLTKGQRLTITGPPGTCAGKVLHVETPANLPSIYGAPEIERVRAILAERRVVQLALIEYEHNGQPVAFIAFTDGAGNWWDLRAQALTIAPA